ncbi:hypothetical protein CBP31_02555 [Oceanisphaera profunda]|uniref:DUF883 domain-containing protein n=1 Tax=Oceanisphaera profunda TaxID=1416627 RepID=A0A1Y0D2B4_9GAMM|nr:DUF883 family protein [Oceanisphaera profunda]ART81649.1 hypothetical protein CBP31_02555 [Oceanisphaera profunda]
MSQRYETERAVLMDDVKQVLKDAEVLYKAAVDDGTQEGKILKEKLKAQLTKAQEQYAHLESNVVEKTRAAASNTNDWVHEKPYHAMGVAAVAGLLLGAFLSRCGR